jgi:hypothetical protein
VTSKTAGEAVHVGPSTHVSYGLQTISAISRIYKSELILINFRFSQWIIVDVDSALGLYTELCG